MLGELGRSGVGEPVVVDRVKSVAELRAKCGTSNAALIGQLRADSNACELLKLTRDDAALGRMTAPTPLSDHNAHLLPEVLLNPRFGVVKEKENGEVKIRAVDHLSWSPGTVEAGDESRPSKRARRDSSVNGYTSPAEKMSHDTVDGLDAVLRHFFEVVGAVPGMFKVCVVVVFVKGGCILCCSCTCTGRHRFSFPENPGSPRASLGMLDRLCGRGSGLRLTARNLSVRCSRLSACLGASGRSHRARGEEVSETRRAAICGRLLCARKVCAY